MENKQDYKTLYEQAHLELENLRRQLEHWETKGRMLRQLTEQQETFATEVELKLGLIKCGASGIKKLVTI